MCGNSLSMHWHRPQQWDWPTQNLMFTACSTTGTLARLRLLGRMLPIQNRSGSKSTCRRNLRKIAQHGNSLIVALKLYQTVEELLHNLFQVLGALRALFRHGAAGALPNLVKKRFGLPCCSILAPHNEATRTMKHDSCTNCI